MRIFVDGGKRIAITRLFPTWRELGHEITDDPNNSNVQLSIVKIRKITNLPVILRLDGVYYDKADDYNKRNKPINMAYGIATGVIYQSHMAKMMCEKYLTIKKPKIYDIIYNGIDNTDWEPPKKHNDINIVACSVWRRVKRLPEIIEVFKDFLEIYPNSKLHIIGGLYKDTYKINHPNIIYYGQMGFDHIKEIYRICDIFLHLCKKDSCPNVVVEAIASQLPVITTNVCGGSTEMCEMTKGCVVVNECIDNIEPDYIYKECYNKISKRTKEDIIYNMIDIIKNKTKVVLPEKLMIKNTARRYIDIMKKVEVYI